MLIAGPLAYPNLPRLFWPVALSLAGVLAAALLVTPIARIAAHGAINYNEGWNAYHQQEALQGKPLYGSPPTLTCNNYPPLSFHFIGLLGRLTGDVNQTGRWVALFSLAFVALLCGAIVRQFTASKPLAAYTALNVVIWLAVYKPDRIGMNDPQFLGTVFSLLGLYAYLHEPSKFRWLSLSAVAFTIAVFTKHNLLAFPAAVCLHMLLEKRWTKLALWSGVTVGGSALLLTLTHWIDGPYFVANLLVPRAQSGALEAITEYATLFQLPIALAIVWSLRNGFRSLRHIVVLTLVLAHALAAAFAGGDGVDKNIFFDSLFFLIIAGALVFAEYAPVVAGWKRRALPLAMLIVAPALGVVMMLPISLRTESAQLKAVADKASDFDAALKILRGRPGPALCENLLLCFDADKPFTYDPYFANSMVKVKRVREDDLVALVNNASFRTVILKSDPGETDLVATNRPRFTARFVEALLARYRMEARLRYSLVMVPRE